MLFGLSVFEIPALTPPPIAPPPHLRTEVITFNANGGSPTQTVSVAIGERYGELFFRQPFTHWFSTLEGYYQTMFVGPFGRIKQTTRVDENLSEHGIDHMMIFIGWFTTPNHHDGVQIQLHDIVTADSPRVLYAAWSDGSSLLPNATTFSFMGNGGMPVHQRMSLGRPHVNGGLVQPTREGFQFTGWFTAPVGGERLSSVSDQYDTFYAQWNPISSPRLPRLIGFNSNGGNLEMQVASTNGANTIEYIFAQVREPIKPLHRFVGWFTEPQGGEQVLANDAITQMEFFAQFEPHPHPFTDISPSAWYVDAVQFVYERGLMNGVSETHFAPEQTLTRAQAATILWNIEGSPNVTFQSVFNDVPNNSPAWYRDAVIWANKNGIVNGYNGYFNPYGEITREQFATILYNYAQFSGVDTSIPEPFNLNHFQDSDEISHWAKNALIWANYHGIINGITEDTLLSQGTATRAQCAMILMRFIQMFES